MKRLYIGAVLAGLAFAAGACKGDPTASLRTGPASFTITPTQTFINTGDTVSLVVVVRDAQLNPVALDVSATSSNTAVATVFVDTARVFVDGATHAFRIAGKGTSGQSTSIQITGGSLKDSALVNIN